MIFLFGLQVNKSMSLGDFAEDAITFFCHHIQPGRGKEKAIVLATSSARLLDKFFWIISNLIME